MADQKPTQIPTQASSQSTKGAATKAQLSNTVKTLQFAWYVGHLITMVSTIFFALSYVRVFPKAYKFWYKLALFGVVESFGVLILQNIKKNGVNLGALIKEDNFQYLILGLVFFVYSPYVLLTLLSFFLFSTFHVLTYTKHFLLPALNIPETHPVSVKIGNFVASNNTRSMQLAALLEVYTFFLLFVRLLTFSRASLIQFVVYFVFIKLRFEKSAYTRNAFKSIEIKVEDVVNNLGQPAVKNAWLNVKGVFGKIGAFHILNDYTKEKAT